MVTAVNSSSAARIYILYRNIYVYPSMLAPIILHHPGQNSGPDIWLPIRFHQGEARAETLIPPKEHVEPRCLGLIPPRRTLRASYSGPRSARDKTRAQGLGAKQVPWVPIFVSPPKLMPLCSNLPLSLSSPGFIMLQLTPAWAPTVSVSPR